MNARLVQLEAEIAGRRAAHRHLCSCGHRRDQHMELVARCYGCESCFSFTVVANENAEDKLARDASDAGFIDATLSLPPQGAVRFLEAFHKYEPEQSAAYVAHYTAEYERIRKERSK